MDSYFLGSQFSMRVGFRGETDFKESRFSRWEPVFQGADKKIV
jgi:hypothetical protein